MADFRVGPASYATGSGDGSGWGAANVLTAKQASDMIAAGTIVAGDRVLFGGSLGHYGLADVALFPAASRALNSGYPAGTQVGTGGENGGITFGTAQSGASKASGITFEGAGDGARSVWDLHGGRTVAQRQIAGLCFRGEKMVVRNFEVNGPDCDYLTNINTAASGNQPETLSFENLCVAVFGGGNTIEFNKLNGNAGPNGFSRYALYVLLPNDSQGANYGKHLTTVIRRNDLSGSFQGLRVDPGGPGGGGQILRYGTALEVYDNDLHDAAWGRRSGDAALPYNAQSHGGHASVSGAFYGRSFFNGNRLWGDCQDALDLITAGMDVCWNLVRDIQSVDPVIWQWSGSAWFQAAWTGNRNGNGLKLGFTGVDGTAPSVWLGSDGVSGGSSAVAEAGNRCVGNRVYRTSGAGVTTNNSNGMFIAHNEFLDTQLACVLLYAKAGNQFVMNNYGRLASNNVAGVACIDIGAGVRVWEFNNIWNAGSNAAARSAYEWNNRSTAARTYGKNLHVNGRHQSPEGGSAYVGTLDVNGGAAQAINYVEGAGFPLGDALQGLADAECLRTARSAGMLRDINQQPIWLPNNLGPYTRPAA